MVSVIIPDAGTVKFHVLDDSVVYQGRAVSLYDVVTTTLTLFDSMSAVNGGDPSCCCSCNCSQITAQCAHYTYDTK